MKTECMWLRAIKVIKVCVCELPPHIERSGGLEPAKEQAVSAVTGKTHQDISNCNKWSQIFEPWS
jgi:hypothetical protein